MTTGSTSSAKGVGSGFAYLFASGIATSITGNLIRRGRMFRDLSAPQVAKLYETESAYGTAAGMVKNLLIDTGC